MRCTTFVAKNEPYIFLLCSSSAIPPYPFFPLSLSKIYFNFDDLKLALFAQTKFPCLALHVHLAAPRYSRNDIDNDRTASRKKRAARMWHFGEFSARSASRTTFREWNGKMTSLRIMQNVIVATCARLSSCLLRENIYIYIYIYIYIRASWYPDQAKVMRICFESIFRIQSRVFAGIHVYPLRIKIRAQDLLCLLHLWIHVRKAGMT